MAKFLKFNRSVGALAGTVLLLAQVAHAQVCPFDNGGSALENDGLVLTRYALGLRGAPMLANTSFAAGDAATIESNINCPSCGLRVTDDKDALNNPIFTVADATIISRKIAGFSGPALTNGITSFGSGSRNSAAAVQSFLLAGCGATGGTVTSVTAGAGLTGGTITASGTIAADTAYLQRRIATACGTGSFVTGIAADGTPTCAAPPASGAGTVTSVGAGYGLVANGPNVVGNAVVSSGLIELANGYILPQGCTAGQVPKSGGGGSWVCAADNAGGGVTNAFVNGGNAFGVPAALGTTDAQNLRLVSGGKDLRATIVGKQHGLRITQATGAGVTSDTAPNVINGHEANAGPAGVSAGVTIAGGGAGVSPDNNAATASFATISGGKAHRAAAYATVAGGDFNRATGDLAAISGGLNNVASGYASVVPGGINNAAGGSYSFAAGHRAKAAGAGSFVWADSIAFDYNAGPANGASNPNSFNVRATGGVNIVTVVDSAGVPTKGLSVDSVGTTRVEAVKVGAAGTLITGIQAGRVLIPAPGATNAGVSPDPTACIRLNEFTSTCHVNAYFAFPAAFPVGTEPRLSLTVNHNNITADKLVVAVSVLSADNVGVHYRVNQDFWVYMQGGGVEAPRFIGDKRTGWTRDVFVDWIAIAQ